MSKAGVRVAILVGALATAIGAATVAMPLLAGRPATNAAGDASIGDLISVPTQPDADSDGCRLALLSGTLVVHPDWGIAVGSGNRAQLVFWPYGYRARLTGDGANLLDRDGRVVAQTGDEVRAAGGMTRVGNREGFAVCPTEVQFLPTASD